MRKWKEKLERGSEERNCSKKVETDQIEKVQQREKK